MILHPCFPSNLLRLYQIQLLQTIVNSRRFVSVKIVTHQHEIACARHSLLILGPLVCNGEMHSPVKVLLSVCRMVVGFSLDRGVAGSQLVDISKGVLLHRGLRIILYVFEWRTECMQHFIFNCFCDCFSVQSNLLF